MKVGDIVRASLRKAADKKHWGPLCRTKGVVLAFASDGYAVVRWMNDECGLSVHWDPTNLVVISEWPHDINMVPCAAKLRSDRSPDARKPSSEETGTKAQHPEEFWWDLSVLDKYVAAGTPHGFLQGSWSRLKALLLKQPPGQTPDPHMESALEMKKETVRQLRKQLQEANDALFEEIKDDVIKMQKNSDAKGLKALMNSLPESYTSYRVFCALQEVTASKQTPKKKTTSTAGPGS